MTEKAKEDRLELSDYRKLISLPDLMELYGFYEGARSSKDGVKMCRDELDENGNVKRKVDGSTKKQDIFIINKNKEGEYGYFDSGDLSTKHSVIDFFMAMHSKNMPPERSKRFGKVISYCKQYMANSEKFIRPEDSKYQIGKSGERDSNGFSRKWLGLKDLENTSFLDKRGIDKKIRTHRYFKPLIKNYINKTKDGKSYLHTAFLMVDQKGERGFAHRNDLYENKKSFGGCIGNRGQMACISVNKAEKLDIIIMTESLVDSMSHYELNYQSLKDKEVKYIDSAGSWESGHTRLLDYVSYHQKPDIIVSGFDNDLPGMKYNVQMLGNLDNRGYIYSKNNELFANSLVKVKTNQENRKVGRCEFIFVCKNQEQGLKYTARLRDLLEEYNLKNESEGFKGRYSSYLNSSSDKLVSVNVEFPNQIPYWQDMSEFLLEHRFSGDLSYKRELPHFLDFNNDLRLEKGIHPKFEYAMENDERVIIEKIDETKVINIARDHNETRVI